jgi:hypothetical protein
MEMESLHMNAKKKEQGMFHSRMHINIVVIVDAFAAKYVFGLMKKNYLNAYILMIEEDAQNALKIVKEEHI